MGYGPLTSYSPGSLGRAEAHQEDWGKPWRPKGATPSPYVSPKHMTPSNAGFGQVWNAFPP